MELNAFLYAIKSLLGTHLFNSSFLTGKFPKVENTRPAHLTSFIELYFLKCGHIDGEDTFYTNSAGHFTDSKGFGSTRSPALDHNTFKELCPCLFTFPDLIVHRNSIPCRKFREIFFRDKFVFHKF